MNVPPLRNPFSRLRTWVRENRAQAEIAAIAGLSIGMIVLMFLITIVIIVGLLR